MAADTGDKPEGLLIGGEARNEHQNGSECDREGAENESALRGDASGVAVVGAPVVRLSRKRARGAMLRQAAQGS